MIETVWENRGVSTILRPVLSFLDYVWPKDRGLVAFSGGHDVGYSDNSRYLFEKFLEMYGDEFEVLWITRLENMLSDASIDEKWRSHMVYLYSFEGLLSLLRAGTVFFSWGFSDLPGIGFSRRKTVIQLWHGIPIKRIGACSKMNGEVRMDSAMRELRRYTYWICNSRIERNSVALCTGIPIDRVKITGYPRNDYLLEHKGSEDARMMMRYPFLKKLVILYAPTYRSDRAVEFFPFDDFEIGEMKEFLDRNDACLLLRTHHVDDVLIRNGPVQYHPVDGERILALNRDTVRDIQDILPHVDILISDYSGIWIDFLLLDRPVIFVPYDLASFEASEGLLYDYDYITPGPKVSSFGEMLRELQQYCSDPTRDSEKRDSIKRMFHQYEDGMAYMRICQLVKDENRRFK